MQRIEIWQDGVWAGTGLVRNGTIFDADAYLGPEGLPYDTGEAQDASDEAYDAIEYAIIAGDGSVEVDGIEYTWRLHDADEDDD